MLTPAGRAQLNVAPVLRSRAELHQAWYSKLPAPQVRILQVLVAHSPEAWERPALASEAGQSPTSSGYTNNLGALRSLGLIDYPTPGKVVVTALLVLFSSVSTSEFFVIGRDSDLAYRFLMT
ncbi:MAG: hypothetical protein H0X37_25940 [Herpetosiphonaceae bacterium]|nr:hypothetical protein [Herpetosiphonaceae bacterium]